jgi:signal transduction histidine kinase
VLDPQDLPDGVVVADGAGTVVLANRTAERLLAGRSLLGLSLAEALPLRDEAGRDFWECLRPYTGLATRTGFPERRLELTSSGRELLVTGRFLRTGGRVERVVVAIRDGAARRRREGDQAELVAVLAHDLRSPLTAVKGFTATLLSHWERFDDEQRRQMLAAVRDDAERLSRLLVNLVDVARVEAGRLDLRRERVDLPGLVDDVVAERVAAGESVQRVQVVRDGGRPEIWADPGRLAHVVRTLVDNAVRHGRGTVTVTVTARQEPAGAVLVVGDEGPGVAPDVLPVLFAPFWRRPRAAGGRGPGLGLYLAGGVVAAHGGTITVDTGPGGGARFTVALPAGEPAG